MHLCRIISQSCCSHRCKYPVAVCTCISKSKGCQPDMLSCANFLGGSGWYGAWLLFSSKEAMRFRAGAEVCSLALSWSKRAVALRIPHPDLIFLEFIVNFGIDCCPSLHNVQQMRTMSFMNTVHATFVNGEVRFSLILVCL